MKLNNNGWGLSTFLVFVCIFALMIIIISVNALKLGFANDNNGNIQFQEQSNYVRLENILVNYGALYYNKYSCEFNKDNACYISVSDLKKAGYIDNFIDKSQNQCDGYVKVLNKKSPNFKAYIKCGDSYQTFDYIDKYSK